MSTARLRALPRRRERHFGDRVVWCFADRPAGAHAGFAAAAAAHPARLALAFGERRWTYAELAAEVARLADGLRQCGIGPGDHVGLLLRNRPEFVMLFYALMRLGAVAVPMDVRLQGPEIGHVVADAGLRLLLHDAGLEARLPAAGVPVLAVPDGAPLLPGASAAAAPPPHAVAEEDRALILYTSGTTGRPKGAVITHLNIVHSCLHHAGNLGLAEDDRSLVAVPLSHVTGLVCGVVAPLWTGGALVLLPHFKAREFLAAAAAWRTTYTIMVPAMYNLCLRVEEFAAHDLSAWRIGHYGGSPMPEATVTALAERLPGLTLVSGYGATETCSPAAMTPVGLGRQPRDAVGMPLPCAEVVIVDPESGVEVPAGESGEIWVRGPMVAQGYWRNPEATAASFIGGFWRSGDIGRLDAEGHLHLHDRLKDVINRGGYKIYSAEVEGVLAGFPGLVEAATVGRPDPVLGERVHAFVSVSAPVTEEALAAFCAARLGDYKVPESWTITTSPLPRNSTGKLAKKALRDLLGGQVTA
jgi:O-succinylbenzoic acid--CoA ligase